MKGTVTEEMKQVQLGQFPMQKKWCHISEASKAYGKTNPSKTSQMLVLEIIKDAAKIIEESGFDDTDGAMHLQLCCELQDQMSRNEIAKVQYGSDFHSQIYEDKTLGHAMYVFYCCGWRQRCKDGTEIVRGCGTATLSSAAWLAYCNSKDWDGADVNAHIRDVCSKWNCANAACGNQNYHANWGMERRTLVWTNMDENQVSFDPDRDKLWIAYVGCVERQYPWKDEYYTNGVPEHHTKGVARWDKIEKLIALAKRIILLKELVDPRTGKVIKGLTLDIIFDAACRLNERTERKFMKAATLGVKRYSAHIPSESPYTDRVMYKDDPRMSIAYEGQQYWGIDLKAAFGEDYLDEIPFMIDDDWEQFLDLIYGFTDIAALKHEQDLIYARRKEKSKNAKPNQTDTLVNELYKKMPQLQTKCFEGLSTLMGS